MAIPLDATRTNNVGLDAVEELSTESYHRLRQWQGAGISRIVSALVAHGFAASEAQTSSSSLRAKIWRFA